MRIAKIDSELQLQAMWLGGDITYRSH
jgi:hypothetical protein